LVIPQLIQLILEPQRVITLNVQLFMSERVKCTVIKGLITFTNGQRIVIKVLMRFIIRLERNFIVDVNGRRNIVVVVMGLLRSWFVVVRGRGKFVVVVRACGSIGGAVGRWVGNWFGLNWSIVRAGIQGWVAG